MLNVVHRLLSRGSDPPKPPAGTVYAQDTPDNDPWNLDRPLVYLSHADPWTIRDACNGVQIFGGIGSGKTSGSGGEIARAFLSSGFGGLVCCAKPEERALWETYAQQTGRMSSLMIVKPGGRGAPAPYRFNFLEYELRRSGAGGGMTENVVNLLGQVVEIVEGKQGPESEGGFWKRGMNELLRAAVDLLSLAGEPLTLDNICRLVLAAPTDPQQPHDAMWRDGSYTFRCILAAADRPMSATEANDYDRASTYWLNAYPGTPDKTRGGIVATFRGVADVLLHGLAWELVATETNIVPEMTYRNGAIIILDLSIQEFREVGRIVQSIWKTMFQQTILRRDASTHPRPVFLWCDESQNFVTSFDHEYQTTARSARACTVYLTQNVNTYHARLGANAHAQVEALLGLFGTKIFHAQSDHHTNQYAADLIGKHWVKRSNQNVSGNTSQDGRPGGNSYSAGRSDSLEYKLEPAMFTTLRKGAPENNYQVDSVIFSGGRTFQSTRDTYALTTFTQRH